MGACQNQFQSVPQLINDDNSPEYQRQQNRFSTNSINLQHKAARANTQNVTIGIIDTKLQSYKSKQLLNSKFNQFGAASIEFTPTRSTMLIRNDSVMKPILKSKQLDRQQLHATQRPFVLNETIKLNPQQKIIKARKQRSREALDLTFYYSLGLAQYVYRPIQAKYKAQFQNLIICEQQQRNGVKYIGEWKNTRTVHGNGVMQSNTTKYIGQFMNGLKHFHGRQIQKYEVYQGEFQNGRRKGQGKRYTQQCEEQGIFDQHLINGLIIYSNGNKFQGNLKNNYYHGPGCYTDLANNIKYQGIFQNGKLNGKGQIILIKDNDVILYDGDFKQGLKHGEGRFNWNPSEYYEGSYSRGKKHGRGRLFKKDACYQGQFSNGKMNGNFIMYRLNNTDWLKVGEIQFNNGVRVSEDQQSTFSDVGLPKEWKQAIEKDQISQNQQSSINQLSQLPSNPIQFIPQNPIANNKIIQQPFNSFYEPPILIQPKPTSEINSNNISIPVDKSVLNNPNNVDIISNQKGSNLNNKNSLEFSFSPTRNIPSNNNSNINNNNVDKPIVNIGPSSNINHLAPPHDQPQMMIPSTLTLNKNNQPLFPNPWYNFDGSIKQPQQTQIPSITLNNVPKDPKFRPLHDNLKQAI